MQMLVAGDWTDGSDAIPVINPYDNSEIDTVPRATAEDIERGRRLRRKRRGKKSGRRPDTTAITS